MTENCTVINIIIIITNIIVIIIIIIIVIVIIVITNIMLVIIITTPLFFWKISLTNNMFILEVWVGESGSDIMIPMAKSTQC